MTAHEDQIIAQARAIFGVTVLDFRAFHAAVERMQASSRRQVRVIVQPDTTDPYGLKRVADRERAIARRHLRETMTAMYAELGLVRQ